MKTKKIKIEKEYTTTTGLKVVVYKPIKINLDDIKESKLNKVRVKQNV